jgi:threonine aldolase
MLEATAHSYFNETGGPAALSGVSCRLLPGSRGIFTGAEVRAAVRPRNVHFPPTKLVCIENTHNRGGGSVWPLEKIMDVAQAAREFGLRMHLDGARLWNASVASGMPEKNYAAYFDSVSVCFSKGLGAPIGSALAGSAEFIARARRFRKMFGGGMRQAGIVAAAALYALEHNRKRLADDHANAKALANGIAHLPGLKIDPLRVETNILVIHLTEMPATELAATLKAEGVLVLATGSDTVRAVTSLEFAKDQVPEAIKAFKKALTQ